MTDMMLIVPDPSDADPQALAERRRQKSRRRAALWGAFLLLGLALGTIYATGFAETGGTNATPTDPTANTNSPGDDEDDSALDLGQPNANITYNWAGRWGSVSNAALYEADLTGITGDYFIGVYLTNQPGGFSDLQLQFRIADVGLGGTCDGTAIDNATDTDDHRVMIFDNNDAQITFSGMNGAPGGLPGNTIYCVGVANYTGNGKDTGGTFIRRSNPNAVPTPTPTFVGTLNRTP